MDQWLPLLIQSIRWLTVLSMLAAVAMSVYSAGISLLKTKQSFWARVLWCLLLLAFGATTFHQLLAYLMFTSVHLRLIYLPLHLTYALGPFLFFATKARLYPQFKLAANDIKHFLLPIAQLTLLCLVTVRPAESQVAFHQKFGFWTLGTFEGLVYVISFGMYSWFSYRFVLHEWHKAQKRKDIDRKWLFKLRWQMRMLKVLGYVFIIHAFFLTFGYFSYRFLKTDLSGHAIYRNCVELSFAFQPAWLALNAWFARRRSL
jgi:hypothetical protein